MDCAYDAFISYRHSPEDERFAREVLERVESWGLKAAIDERDFERGADFLNEMERCVRESRFTLAVISPRYLESGNCNQEKLICKVLDMSERTRRLLPLIIEKVGMPTWLYSIVGIDFTRQNPLVDPWELLRATLTGTPTDTGGHSTREALIRQAERIGSQRQREEEGKRLLSSEEGVRSAAEMTRQLGTELQALAQTVGEKVGGTGLQVDVRFGQIAVTVSEHRLLFEWALPYTNSLDGVPFCVCVQQVVRVPFPEYKTLRTVTLRWSIGADGQLGWAAHRDKRDEVLAAPDLADEWVKRLLDLASKPRSASRRGRGVGSI